MMSLLTTNWPNEFSDLKKLDEILQCPICYEYINTCMITSCSHNFCSVCIRKYLQYKTQCPTCSEETYGSDLRKNRPLDEIVSLYTNIKEDLLYRLRLINVTQSIKGCQTDPDVGNGPSFTPKKHDIDSADKVTPKLENHKKRVVQNLFSEKKDKPLPEPLVIGGLTIPPIFQPHKSPKKNANIKKLDTGPCPVCNVEIPLKNMNLHLDSCLAAADPVKKPKPKLEKRKPLVKLVYPMVNSKELKKHLKDHGLSIAGDRKEMIRRLNRYTVLYNAECDCENPRPVSEILKQVEREEREEKLPRIALRFTSNTSVPIKKTGDVKEQEVARKEYLESNKDHFNNLIEAMRQREGRNIKPLKPLNRIDSDDEEKPNFKSPPSLSPLDIYKPSTSKVSHYEFDSVYSQATLVLSDSEEDMFEKSPVKVEPGAHEETIEDNEMLHESPLKSEHIVHQINWAKTKVNDEFTLEELENKDIKPIMQDEDSNSYESVFDKSARSESSSIRTPIGRKHNLSARKKVKTPTTPEESLSTSNMESMVDEIFDKPDEKSCASESSESEESNDEVEEEDEKENKSDEEVHFKTPIKKYDVSPEISPMKTRSKRKCLSSTEEKKKLTRSAKRKRINRSVSPCY